MHRLHISKYTKSHQCLSKQNTIKQANNKTFNIVLHTDILVQHSHLTIQQSIHRSMWYVNSRGVRQRNRQFIRIQWFCMLFYKCLIFVVNLMTFLV